MLKEINNSVMTAFIFVLTFALPAKAAYLPFNTKVSLNVGIGTSAPGSNLSVLGSESLGAYATNAAPPGGLIMSGNIGIGSLTPGQSLDVQGSVRILGNGNVGIGTTFIGSAGEGALTIMNGNVGIGTWVPGQGLDVTQVPLRNGPGATLYTSPDLICDNTGTINTYSCAASVGTTETYFTNPVATIPGIATTSPPTLDGIHRALETHTNFDNSGDGSAGAWLMRLNACSSYNSGTQTCSGRAVLFKAAQNPGSSHQSNVIDCTIIASSSSQTLGVSCMQRQFNNDSSTSSVVTSVPDTTGSSWVLVWSITFSVATHSDVANQVGSANYWIY